MNEHKLVLEVTTKDALQTVAKKVMSEYEGELTQHEDTLLLEIIDKLIDELLFRMEDYDEDEKDTPEDAEARKKAHLHKSIARVIRRGK